MSASPPGPGPPSDPHLRVDHLAAGLRQRTVRGGVITMFGQGAKLLLQLASTVVLARLLVPADFGLIAMVTAITRFIALFRELGLSSATVQKEDLTRDQVSALFWINVLMGFAMAAATAALAWPIAHFYGEPRLVSITLALATAFVFGGISVQHGALLRRQMRFRALMAAEVTAQACCVAAAIGGALAGWGYWALVGMQLVAPLVMSVALWVASGWRPGPWKRHVGARELVAFGGRVTAFNVLNYLSRNADNVIIGRSVGEAALGFYDRAYQLLLLPINGLNAPITNVAVPALTRLAGDAARFRAYYHHGLLLVASLGMPFVALCFAETEGVIRLLLGSQWLDAAPIFKALAPAAFIGTFHVSTGWVFLATGRVDRQLVFGGYIMAPLNIIAFLVGVQWGALGVAWALSIVTCVSRPFAFAYCFRQTPVGILDLWLALWRPAVSSIAACALVMAVPRGLGGVPPTAELIARGAAFALAFAALWRFLPGGGAALRSCLSLLNDLRARPPQAATSEA